MAAITQVRVEGFQSHVNSSFNLGNGLNVITGPSDAGKTAIIRAIRWVAFNEPQGEAFVNEKVGEALVAITLENGAIITKRRRKGKTSYLLQQSEDDEGSLYEKSEVPDEVKHLLKIEKQTFGDFETALNFAFQLDAPFLISETASAGAKILGKLAGTESVDLAIKGVSKDTYGTRQDRTNAEKDIERIAGAMLAYQGIDDAKEAVDLAEMLLEQIERNHKKFESLKEFRTIYEVAQDKLNALAVKLDRLSTVKQLEEDLQNIEKAQQRYDLLLQAYGEYLRLRDRISGLDKDLEKYKDVQLAVDYVAATTNDLDKLTTLNNLFTEYQKYTVDFKKSFDVLEKIKGLPAFAVRLIEIETDLETVNDLKMIKYDFQNVARRTELAQERVKAFEGLTEAEALLNTTDESLGRLQLLKTLALQFQVTNTKYKEAILEANNAEDRITAADYELRTAWEAAGGICPLCEQPHEGGRC